MKLRSETKTKNSKMIGNKRHAKPPKWPTQKDWNEMDLTTKTKRPKRPKWQTKKIDKNKWMPRGVRLQLSYSSHLDYDLLLICLTGVISLLPSAWREASRKPYWEKKINKKLTYIDVVNEYRYLFFLLLMLWYSIWPAFRPKNYKKN